MKKQLMIKLSTATLYDNKYYITLQQINGLFSYNINQKKLKYLMPFETSRKYDNAYLKSFLYNGEIWFLPCEADDIAIFDTKKFTLEYLSIPQSKKNVLSKIKYNNYLIFEEYYVCFVPRNLNDVLILNLKTKKIEDIFSIADDGEEYQNALYMNKKLYLYPWTGKRCAILDLKTKKVEYRVCAGEKEYGDAVYIEDRGLVMRCPATATDILIEDVYTGRTNLVKTDFDNDNLFHTFFASVFSSKIFLWGSGYVLVVEMYNVNQMYFLKINQDNFLFPIDTRGAGALVFGGNKIIEYDEEKDAFNEIDICYEWDVFFDDVSSSGRKIWDLCGNSMGLMQESESFNITQFVYCILNTPS